MTPEICAFPVKQDNPNHKQKGKMKVKNARFISSLAAMALAATSLSAGFGVSAETYVAEKDAKHSVTITKPETDEMDHTYQAFQIFKGVLSGTDADNAAMTYIEWGAGVDKTKLAAAVDGAADIIKTAITAYNNQFTEEADAAKKLVTPFSGDKDAEKFAEIISANANTPGFAEAVADMFSKALAAAPTATATKAESYKFSNLETGYYIFQDKPESLDVDKKDPNTASYTDYILKPVFLEVTENEVLNVSSKSDVPTIEKNIVVGTDKKKADTAAVGDTINYQVDTFIPDMQGYTKYYFVANDTMCKGLTFQPDKVAITIEDGVTLKADEDFNVETTTLTDDPDTAVNEEGQTKIEIVFKNFIQYKGNEFKYNEKADGEYYKLKDGTYTTVAPTAETTADYDSDKTYEKVNRPIHITYSAILNEKCDRTALGNENTVDLTFSNNPNVKPGNGDEENPDKPGPDDVTGKTPPSTTKVYTTGIRVIKVDAQGNKVTGATFRLYGEKLNKAIIVTGSKFIEAEDGTYFLLKNGSYTKTAATAETAADYAEGDKKYKQVDYTETTKEKATLEDADSAHNGESYVEATVDEEGYLVFSGLNAGTYTLVETKAPDGYNIDASEYTIVIGNQTGFPTLTSPGWTVKDGDAAVVNVTDNTINNSNGFTVATKQIVNKKGIILPSTGGIGTVIFYIVGSLLIGGAAVLFVTKKKKAAK